MTRDELLQQARQDLTFAKAYREVLATNQDTVNPGWEKEEKEQIQQVLAEATRQVLRLEAEIRTLQQMPKHWQVPATSP